MRADVVIVGAGVGGCAAALAAARLGRRVVLTEETDWIGGQLTTQAVPPDEHPWIEHFGCTRSYRAFREGVRRYYRTHFPLTARAASDPYLNPGNGWVSRLCHDPRVALAVLQAMLAPYLQSGQVTLLTGYRPVAAETEGDRLLVVAVAPDPVYGAMHRDRTLALEAPFFLDATETGELLPLAGVEYVTGAEAQAETAEPHARPGEAQPLNMQGITFCFAIDHRPGEEHIIERPRQYDFWRAHRPEGWPGPLLGWTAPDPQTLRPRVHRLFPPEGPLDPETLRTTLWLYRRIVDGSNFERLPGTATGDVTLVNWPQNDYWLGPVLEVPEEEAARHLEGARQLSLSLLYWLQTEAPRPDGGEGWPGLRLRADVVGGTPDGLAKRPYIRESRRIRAEFTVLEQHIGYEAREGRPAERFPDTVGIGAYRIDLHPSTGGDTYIDVSSMPFQIPLGALIPVRLENLLPACKNIGTTHITNGAYRLHPVEWNVGEAAGSLAAFCLERRRLPRQVRRDPALLAEFQGLLASQGVELEWPRVGPL